MRKRDPVFDLRNLIPRAPDYAPRRGYGWICWVVWDSDSLEAKICDTITVSEQLDKGFSAAMGELDYGQLQMAKEMYEGLRAKPGARIVNASLIH